MPSNVANQVDGLQANAGIDWKKRLALTGRVEFLYLGSRKIDTLKHTIDKKLKKKIFPAVRVSFWVLDVFTVMSVFGLTQHQERYRNNGENFESKTTTMGVFPNCTLTCNFSYGVWCRFLWRCVVECAKISQLY